MSTNPSKTAKVQVTLAKDHRHAGKLYKADHKIDVTEADARWLEQHGVIAPRNSADASTKPAPKPAATTTEK